MERAAAMRAEILARLRGQVRGRRCCPGAVAREGGVSWGVHVQRDRREATVATQRSREIRRAAMASQIAGDLNSAQEVKLKQTTVQQQVFEQQVCAAPAPRRRLLLARLA